MKTTLPPLLFACMLVACGGGADVSAPTSTSADGGQAAAQASERRTALAVQVSPVQITVTADVVLNWAEYKFADLFPVFGSRRYASVQFQGIDYTARQYSGPEGPRYLGITRSGAIFGLGDFTAGRLQSFGAIANWTSDIQADRCLFDHFSCSRGVAGRKWDAPMKMDAAAAPLALGYRGTGTAAMSDTGDVMAVYERSDAAQTGVHVVRGTVDRSSNAVAWSNPQRVDVAGGQPVGNALAVTRNPSIAVSPNGDAVVVFSVREACTPKTFRAGAPYCLHVYAARYSSRLQRWQDAVRVTDANNSADRFKAYLNDQGDVAIIGDAVVNDGVNFLRSTKAVYLCTASESRFRVVTPDKVNDYTNGSHALGLDDQGNLLYVTQQTVAGSDSVTVYSGHMSEGLGAAWQVPGATNYLAVASGRNGQQVIVLDSTRVAIRAYPGDSFEILKTGSDGFGEFRRVVVTDAGETLLFERYLTRPRYFSHVPGAGWSAPVDMPTLFPFGSNDLIAINRRGDAVSLLPDGNCRNGAAFGYNRAANEMTFPAGWNGPSATVTGKVDCPAGLYGFAGLDLSLNGMAFVSMGNSYTAMPTAGSAGVLDEKTMNLWGSYLK